MTTHYDDRLLILDLGGKPLTVEYVGGMRETFIGVADLTLWVHTQTNQPAYSLFPVRPPILTFNRGTTQPLENVVRIEDWEELNAS